MWWFPLFPIFPAAAIRPINKKGYIGINAYDWLEDEKLYVYVSQDEELAAFTDFFMNRFATK